jgi:hypothetical protein
VRRFLFENGLSAFFLAIFVVTLVGQSFVGQHAHNAEELAHGGQPLSWLDYILSPSFGGAVLENWQSEFLQFTLFILATVWLVQKGSKESKPLGDTGVETKQKQQIGSHAPANAPRWAKLDDWRTRLYENSLVLVMTAIFLATWGGQSVNNWRDFNQTQREHGDAAISWASYVAGPDFWEKTLQNWQSEFLAVGTMAIFTVYLRQRGSPESKPVGAPYEETGSEG